MAAHGPEIAAEGRIEELQASGSIESEQGFILRVDNAQGRSKLLEHSYRCGLIIHEHPPTAIGHDFPPQDQLIRGVQTIALESLPGCDVGEEHR